MFYELFFFRQLFLTTMYCNEGSNRYHTIDEFYIGLLIKSLYKRSGKSDVTKSCLIVQTNADHNQCSIKSSIGRSLTCKHLQCFDIENFVKEKKRSCPICKRKIKVRSLYIDDEFTKFNAEDRHFIILFPDTAMLEANIHNIKLLLSQGIAIYLDVFHQNLNDILVSITGKQNLNKSTEFSENLSEHIFFFCILNIIGLETLFL